jgi:hypothetical protein
MCVENCVVGSSFGICRSAPKSQDVYVGGNNSKNDILCGSEKYPCASLDEGLERLDRLAGSTLFVYGYTYLSNNVDITGLSIQSGVVNQVEVVDVLNPLRMSVNVGTALRSTSLSNLDFELLTLQDWSGPTLVDITSNPETSSYSFLLVNVRFLFHLTLSASLISLKSISSQFTFSYLKIDGLGMLDTPVRNKQALSNVDSGICDPLYAALIITSSSGSIAYSSFTYITAGAIIINNSTVSIVNTAFSNNVYKGGNYSYSLFPHLSHNVVIKNGSTVNIESVSIVGDSYFIAVDENSVINYLQVPLFIPQLNSISRVINTTTGELQISFYGAHLYPCGLKYQYVDSSGTKLSDTLDVYV